MRRPSIPRVRPHRGVAAVEFAILLGTVLVPLTFSVAELGRAAYYYTTLSKNVRDAARYATLGTPGSSALSAKCLAVTGSLANGGGACTQPTLLPGLTVANVTVCDRVLCAGTHGLTPVVVGGVTRGSAYRVSVTISGLVFPSLAGGPFSFTFDPISATFTVKA